MTSVEVKNIFLTKVEWLHRFYKNYENITVLKRFKKGTESDTSLEVWNNVHLEFKPT
jgi:hypothetical protein